MRKQYLHLSVYDCDLCAGLVVTGSVAVRENEISKETGVRGVGAICLSCGHRPEGASQPARIRHLSPIEWEPLAPVREGHLSTAYAEALNRAELR
jgi:hypothetical protein